MRSLTQLPFLTLLVLGMTITLSCKKSDTSTPAPAPAPQPAKLQVTVKLFNSTSVETGATVHLFKSDSERVAKVNEVATATTDQSGIALFSNLEPISYYFNIYSSDNVRSNGYQFAITSAGPLKRGETFKTTVPIK